MMAQSATTKSTVRLSLPRVLLSIEGVALFAGALTLYVLRGYSGWAFALFLLAPDLSAVGYLINLRTGAAMYNTVHTYALPMALGMLSLILGWGLGIQVALIWLAHIGMDRAVGYGLKYPTAFKDTHLSRV
jgi:hypothetical protein